jgi:hypothetical protein
MHTEALQLLQLDLLGQVEPAAPFKNHESTAIWCQITHPGPATLASPALSTDFQLKISTKKRKKSTLRIHRTPNNLALCRNEVRILIFDDLAELER